MSDQLIREAFDRRLNGITPALSTAFENMAFPPVNNVPYQRVILLPAEPENPSVGATLHRALGVYQVTLLYPINAGPETTWLRAEAIKDRFPRGLTMSHEGITVLITNTPSAARIDYSADRYAVAVRIRYSADIFS